MTEQEFWDVIQLLDWSRLEADEEFGVIRPVVDALLMKSTADIMAFDDLLSEKLYQLDGAAYAEAAGVSGQYEDLFLYARCCVIANGEDAYNSVKETPELMPSGLDFDELLFVAERAWAVKTGGDYHHRPAYSMEMHANQANWPPLPS
ncbi:MAG: DUF4240 domain-containing protein [Planctomycetota bacterium]